MIRAVEMLHATPRAVGGVVEGQCQGVHILIREGDHETGSVAARHWRVGIRGHVVRCVHRIGCDLVPTAGKREPFVASPGRRGGEVNRMSGQGCWSRAGATATAATTTTATATATTTSASGHGLE